MFKLKTSSLLDKVACIIMAMIYCSVAAYFVSIRINVVDAIITILSFVIGAIIYFKLSFRKVSDEIER